MGAAKRATIGPRRKHAPPGLGVRAAAAIRLLTPFATLSALWCCAAGARGDEPHVEADGPRTATYLRLQLQAEEELTRARDLAARREWDRAAEVYQSIIDRFGESILPAGDAPTGAAPAEGVPPPNADNASSARPDIERFVSLPQRVFAEILSGPAELRRAYERRYAPAVRRALAAADGDAAATVRAAGRCLATTAAADALARLAAERFEAGAFDESRVLYSMLLRSAPADDAQRMRWSALRALCDACLGDADLLRELAAAQRAAPAATRVVWGGSDRTLAEFIEQALASFERSDPGATEPPVGGKNAVSAALPRDPDVTPEARLWRFEFSAPDRAAAHEAEERAPAPDGGRRLTRVPVMHRGLVFVCDGAGVTAIDPSAPDAPVWRHFAPSVAHLLTDGDRWQPSEQSPPLTTVSADSDDVFAYLDRREGVTDKSIDGAALVALDAATGRQRWRNNLAELAAPFDELSLDAAPLVCGDRLVAVVRRRKPFGFETCLLACFDRRDGRLAWNAHVGEAATGGYGYYRPTRAFPIAAGGLAFVNSNLGTVAAINLFDGRPAWLLRYPSKFGDAGAAFALDGEGEHTPWSGNPVLPWRNCIVVAPLDAAEVLVLQRDDGRVVQRIAHQELRGPQAVLGVAGDRLFAVGTRIVCYDLGARRVEWERPIPAGRLYGRGAVTAHALFVPTDVALLRYPLDGGSPARYAWPADEAGHVLPAPGQLLVAAAGGVSGLVAKQSAFDALAARMNARPDDPLPAVRLAELSFRTAEYQRGIDSIDLAFERAGGAARMTDPRLRARVFNACSETADALAAAAGADGEHRRQRLALALQLVERASLCAPDVDRQVRFRLQRADIQALAGDYPAAVASLQQILSDPGLAARSTPADAARELCAGLLARERIDRLIFEQGRGVYDAAERAAADDLRLSAASADPGSALLATAERFPNSAAAAAALIRAAEHLRRAGRADEAVRALLRARRPVDPADEPRVLRMLAELLAATGRPTAADDVLRRALRAHPNARFEPDAGTAGFADLLARLSAAPAPPAARSWRAPLRETGRVAWPAEPVVLAPLVDPSIETRQDGLFVWCDGRLDLLRSTGGRAWSDPPRLAEKPSLLSYDARRVWLATRRQIIGLDRDTGRERWRAGGDARGADQPAVDPEWVESWIAHALGGDRVFGVTNRGQIVAYDADNGRELWRADAPDAAARPRPVTDGRRLVYGAWVGRINFINVLDARSGERLFRAALAAERPLQQFAFTDDGYLLAISATSAHSIDPDTGVVRWGTVLHGRAAASSVCVAADGLFLSLDGARLSRFDLNGGRLLWTSAALAAPANSIMRLTPGERCIYAATEHGISAVEVASGAVLWEAADLDLSETLRPRLVDDLLMAAVVSTGASPSESDRANAGDVARDEDPDNAANRLAAGAADADVEAGPAADAVAPNAAERGNDAPAASGVAPRCFDARTGTPRPLPVLDDRGRPVADAAWRGVTALFVYDRGLFARRGSTIVVYEGAPPAAE